MIYTPSFHYFWPALIPLFVFGIVLKGAALWRSARRGEKGWFIAIFIINSLGILPLFYLLTHPEERVSKKKK